MLLFYDCYLLQCRRNYKPPGQRADDKTRPPCELAGVVCLLAGGSVTVVLCWAVVVWCCAGVAAVVCWVTLLGGLY